MDTMRVIVWALPVLFMLHDFEEIILVKVWRSRYAHELAGSQMRKTPFGDFRSTDSFSIAVEIEFIVLIITALLSCVFNSYFIWYAMFFGFTFHFFIHFILCGRFKHYVPGAATSVLFLSPCVYILYLSSNILKMSSRNILLYSLLGLVLVVWIVFVLHKSMRIFENWLIRFENGKKI